MAGGAMLSAFTCRAISSTCIASRCGGSITISIAWAKRPSAAFRIRHHAGDGQRPHLARLFWFATLLDAAMHREWIMKLEQSTVPKRIAHVFAEIWRRFDMVGLGLPRRLRDAAAAERHRRNVRRYCDPYQSRAGRSAAQRSRRFPSRQGAHSRIAPGWKTTPISPLPISMAKAPCAAPCGMSPVRAAGFVFVAGLHRTGTSLLARILAAHPAVSAITDAPVPENEGCYLQGAIPHTALDGRPVTTPPTRRSTTPNNRPGTRSETRRRLLEDWGPGSRRTSPGGWRNRPSI